MYAEAEDIKKLPEIVEKIRHYREILMNTEEMKRKHEKEGKCCTEDDVKNELDIHDLIFYERLGEDIETYNRNTSFWMRILRLTVREAINKWKKENWKRFLEIEKQGAQRSTEADLVVNFHV